VALYPPGRWGARPHGALLAFFLEKPHVHAYPSLLGLWGATDVCIAIHGAVWIYMGWTRVWHVPTLQLACVHCTHLIALVYAFSYSAMPYMHCSLQPICIQYLDSAIHQHGINY
jgi:hypothetical protein